MYNNFTRFGNSNHPQSHNPPENQEQYPANGERNSSRLPLPETLENPIFTPAFLEQHIGKLMRLSFLIGSEIVDRTGVLKEIGASFIVIEPVGLPGVIELCDLFSLKFADIIVNNANNYTFIP